VAVLACATVKAEPSQSSFCKEEQLSIEIPRRVERGNADCSDIATSKLYFSCLKFTVLLVMKGAVIVEAAPIVKRFEGQTIGALTNWGAGQIRRTYCGRSHILRRGFFKAWLLCPMVFSYWAFLPDTRIALGNGVKLCWEAT